ncbi:MAG: transcriptional regulator [Firmicutes bacterium]|nr:transcriptional regulator [Bacillota bacterium]
MNRDYQPRFFGDILHNTDNNLSNLLSVRFKVFNITPEQWNLLNSLILKDGINQKELAQTAGKTQTIVTRMLDILERKGFVERRADPRDRRAYLVFITEKGRSLQQTLVSVGDKTMKMILKNILPERLELFYQICEDINRSTTEVMQNLKK